MGLNLGVMSAAVTLDDHDYRRTLSGLEGASRSTFKNIASMAAQFLSLYSVYAGIKVATEKFYAQQDAIESVRASLRNLGAEYIGATARFQKFAAEIQKKTKFGDEYVLGAMSSGLRLGINPEDIENVTKSAIGLTAKLGVDLPTAMKLLARANAGHTEMLSRMGLQIDESLSKEEKFQHVLKAGADAFGLAEEAAKTAGGKLAQFKNNAGDAAEFVGKRLQDALAPSISLLNGLALSFNESDKATQGLVVNITAAAAAFALLAKSGALAQANTAFAGRASIVLANGWGAAKKAANGLAAAIGPVGAA
ncbi:MAG: hypothetical protein J6Y54_06825, partial [Lentisphaeria bacterium]|nr:hypothetical protein [Lentisphaeria bacterium]